MILCIRNYIQLQGIDSIQGSGEAKEPNRLRTSKKRKEKERTSILNAFAHKVYQCGGFGEVAVFTLYEETSSFFIATKI